MIAPDSTILPSRAEYLYRAKIALMWVDEADSSMVRDKLCDEAVVHLFCAGELRLAARLRRGGDRAAEEIEAAVDVLMKAEGK